MSLVALLWACSAPAPVPPPDVVLITLDTTRADRVGAYGYADAHTEALDALAASGRRYSRAYSPLPLTIPAHATLFTGLYPPRHGVRDNGGAVLDGSFTTLAEVFAAAGYATAASTSAFVTTSQWGLDQGFDAYFDLLPPDDDPNVWRQERRAEAVVDDLVAWRASVGGPRFAWAHLYDPHAPYDPPAPYLELAQGRPYDGELAYADAQVGRLVAAFSDRPTLFVVAGDHGEGLGDRGELQHGLFVYDATQHVPLIVSGPGVDPAVVDEVVSLADVVPTVLDLLGLAPPEALDGRVVPGTPPRPVYLESYQLRDRFGLAPHLGVVDGDRKLIALPRPELYAPGDREDIAASEPATVARLQAALEGFGFGPPGRPTAPLDPETALQLQQLGYVQGGFSGDTDGPLPDPKDHRDLLAASERVTRMASSGATEDALALLAELTARHPDVAELHARHAALLAAMGRHAEAGAVARAAWVRHPDHPALRMFVAQALVAEGKAREASDLLVETANSAPWMPSVRAMAIAALVHGGAPDEAFALAEDMHAAYPDDHGVAGFLGVMLAGAGDLRGARPLLEQGVLADRPVRGVRLHLAALAGAEGRPVEARALLEREADDYPGDAAALRALYRLYAAAGEWSSELAVVDRLLALEDDPVLWHARAQCQFNLGAFATARATLDEALARYPDASLLILLDANLLAQEGHPEAATQRFEQAKAARDAEASRGAAPSWTP